MTKKRKILREGKSTGPRSEAEGQGLHLTKAEPPADGRV